MLCIQFKVKKGTIQGSERTINANYSHNTISFKYCLTKLERNWKRIRCKNLSTFNQIDYRLFFLNISSKNPFSLALKLFFITNLLT